MKEEHKQCFRENWEAVKKQHGELWEQTCAELRDDLMDGVGKGQSVMSKAIFCAFEARRSGQDDVADLMLALGWEFSANDIERLAAMIEGDLPWPNAENQSTASAKPDSYDR